MDTPTRPRATQRFVLLAPAAPKAAIALFAGGHGGLREHAKDPALSRAPAPGRIRRVPRHEPGDGQGPGGIILTAPIVKDDRGRRWR